MTKIKKIMKPFNGPEMTSVSGGQTSAYLAANFPTEYNVFALVRTEDQRCLYPDARLRQVVEDRIQAPFIGTMEDDLIIHTILDLEQFLGREITWVTGITYDEVIRSKGGWLPNKLHRYCTTWMKLQPIFDWWLRTIGYGNPIKTQIGYRATPKEIERANKMLRKLDKDGFLRFKGSISTWSKGTNKGKKRWEQIPFQRPYFPLIEAGVRKDKIIKYWEGKPVVFAPLNNCVGCFHRHPVLLKKMFVEHPNKMQWFKEQEILKTKANGEKGTWRNDHTYAEIENFKDSLILDYADFGECDTGFCGL